MTVDGDMPAEKRVRRQVTLQDVADFAGVSRSSASFALTNRGRVSEATRERVRQAAKELGYHPNRVARNLRAKRSGIIGLCLPAQSTKRTYYMDVTFGAVEAAQDKGLLVAVMTGNGQLNSLLDFDGLIVFDPERDSPVFREAEQAGVPVVVGERPLQESMAIRGIVHGDHENTFPQLLEHLAKQGARHPALISPVGSTDWASSARTAYVRWCEAQGIEPRIFDTSFPGTSEEVHEAAIELVDDPHVDAIVSMTDGTVLEVLAAAIAADRVVGEDLLVAGAADSPVLTHTDPHVTSLDLHPREFGAHCLQLLVRLLDEEADGVVIETSPVDLNVRASTIRGLRRS